MTTRQISQGGYAYSFCPAALGPAAHRAADINTVEIAGDGVPEYHVAQRYVTQTDAAGAYRLPPVARVARLTVAANRADFIAPINLTVGPAYATGVQQVDFLLRP